MNKNIDSRLVETRIFNPSQEFSRKARIASFAEYKRLYEASIKNPEEILGRAGPRSALAKKVEQGARVETAVCEMVRRRKTELSAKTASTGISTARAQQGSIIWEGEPGERRTLTYQQLHREVCRFANVLKRNGVKKGDRVIIYMPMVPEAAIAMLACARIGAVHSRRLRRIQRRKHSPTASSTAGPRWSSPPTAAIGAAQIVPLKKNVDDALRGDTRPVKRVIVFRRAGTTTSTSRKAATSGGIAKLDYVSADCPPSRSIASIRFSFSTPAVRPENRRAFCTPPAAICSASTSTTKYVFDLRDDDIYLVHRRCRLGHRPQLRRLRPARQWRDHAHVRRRAELAGAGPLLADHRRIRRHHSLHRADRHSRLHEMGRRMA